MEKHDFKRLEFHRSAMALMPEENDPDPGTAFWIESGGSGLNYDYCTCRASKEGHCRHLKALGRIVAFIKNDRTQKLFDEAFQKSMWMELASCMNEVEAVPLKNVRVGAVEQKNGFSSLDLFLKDKKLMTFSGSSENISAFFERSGFKHSTNTGYFYPRADVLEALYKHTLSDTERQLLEMGHQTRRQAFEDSFWFRFGYHCFFESGFNDRQLLAKVDAEKGVFSYQPLLKGDSFDFILHVPPGSVKNTSLALKKHIKNCHEIRISSQPLKSVLKMSMSENNDLIMELYLRLGKTNGEDRLYRREELDKSRFGSFYYLSDEKMFAELEKKDLLIKKFRGKYKRVAKNEKIPELLNSLGDSIRGRSGIDIVDESVTSLKIFKAFDCVTLNPEAVEKDWCWLSIEYGFGNSSVSLSDIWQAKKNGKRYIATKTGWVDSYSLDIDGFTSIPGLDIAEQLARKQSVLKLSGADLFRIMAASKKPVSVPEKNGHKKRLEKIIALKASKPFPSLTGMTSELRNYQVAGSQWLTFLYENNFSGLLCDDMGLGKTHQVMAFMQWLNEIKKSCKPFLIVAPVTVISHWETKLRIHVPGLNTFVYHGPERRLPAKLTGNDVILTSFGLLRGDCRALSEKQFSIAVFDEAQQLKNKKTKVYKAATIINAEMKLCVTGTPVENRLEELKALMDISFPGYLGSDDAFNARYVRPVAMNTDSKRREELSRVINPFTLRRLKTTVLDELPPKIEDIRTCELSEDQVKLYRDAIASKGNYLDALKKEDSKISYVHIFALLALLKQICNHPALVEKKLSAYDSYESGKWELFKEILSEAIASGQKTVVYTQYVGMVKLIASYLKKTGVDAVALTGASKNRGKIIDRFNTDPDCMVFVGSLLAGGTGIDLVSASVVIHYDRWWNAAKEDQATDRVHRIGQKKGVQVFKLVTKGTLEEKISSIIEKKRDLMDSIVREDDSTLLKTFSREQLIDLLELP